MPDTKKLILHPGLAAKVSVLLNQHGFTFSDHEHAFWRASKDGATIVFYKKGTLLFQGNDQAVSGAKKLLESFIGNAKIIGNEEPSNSHSAQTTLGLDESGKGDYFGPLVLAGAIAGPKEEIELKALGVMDSKKLSASAIENLAGKIESITVHRVRIIMPEEYNRLYAQHNNLNLLMADEYKKLIASFDPSGFDHIILDKFSASASQNQDLKRSAPRDMTIVERAEAYIPVAAASILARYYFVKSLEQVGKQSGFDLPLGSGPQAGKLFTRLKKDLPRTEFEKAAKAHFKEREELL